MINLTIQVDESNVKDSVELIFKEMTAEDRKTLAMLCLKEYLNQPVDHSKELSNYQEELVRKFRSGELKRRSQWGCGFNENTPEREIMDDYAYQDELKKFKPTKEYMLAQIREEVISYYKSEIREQIKKDEDVVQIKEITCREIIKEMPSIIMTAFVAMFANHIKNECSYMMTDMMTKLLDSQKVVESIKKSVEEELT